MIQYLLKRVLLMIPTLLGISLLTLMLIHLSPGDPVQSQMEGAIAKGGLSKEDLEAVRRTYYLDLPIFINFSPQDANVLNKKLIEQLQSDIPSTKNYAIRNLKFRGSIILKDLIPVLPTLQPDLQKEILDSLTHVAKRMELGYSEKFSESEAINFWKKELDRLNITEPRKFEIVDNFISNPTKENTILIKSFDTILLNAIFDRLLEMNPSSVGAMILTDILSQIAGTSMTITEEDKENARIAVIDDWKRWWGPRKSDFIYMTGFSSITAIITETQYAKWLSRMAHLDFDRSNRDKLPIKDKLIERLKVTLGLSVLSLLFAYMIAIPIGIYSVVRQYTLTDRIITLLLFMLYSMPSFWVAMLLQQYLCGVDQSVGVSLFPLVGLTSSNFDSMSLSGKFFDISWHLVLPVVILTYRSLAALSRFQRVSMLDIIRQDYIRTARAKGLTERVVILKHALRNSLMAIITLLGMHLPATVGGAVIVETIFQINGMGYETLQAIVFRDINWIMASVTLTAVLTMFGMLFSDILYVLVDPRIQVGESNS